MSLVSGYGSDSNDSDEATSTPSMSITNSAPPVTPRVSVALLGTGTTDSMGRELAPHALSYGASPQGDPNAGLRLVASDTHMVTYNPTYQELCSTEVSIFAICFDLVKSQMYSPRSLTVRCTQMWFFYRCLNLC